MSAPGRGVTIGSHAGLLGASFLAVARATAAADAPAPQPPRAFALLEYQIEGNTLLPVIDVERAVMPYLGESRTVQDVRTAQQHLEQLYHDRGYKTVVVNIPAQRIVEGVVHLKVVEAPVANLAVTGSRWHSLNWIRGKLAQFREGSVPNFPEVQKELTQVNRQPDLHVTPVLRAADTPGQVEVELQVADTLPLHASVELDNRSSANTTALRASADIHYDNLFQRGQSLSLQYQVAPEHAADAKIASVSYLAPLAGDAVLALYGVHSDSNVAAVGNLDVVGRGNIYGVRFVAPLPRGGDTFFNSITVGADYKDFRQEVGLQGADTIATPVHYAPFLLQYSASWLGGADPAGARAATTGARSSTTLDFGLNFLIRGLGTDAAQFAAKRYGADPSYVVLRPGLTRQQLLPWDWSLVARLELQIASDPLISNEEFAAGGADSVRGYTEAERLGDDGERLSLELRTPLLARAFGLQLNQTYALLFVDGAHLRIISALAGQEASYDLASAGFGMRLKARGLELDLDAAHVFKGGYVTLPGDNRLLFRTLYVY